MAVPTPPSSGFPFPVEPVPPDVLAWAAQTLDVDDVLEQIRQIESGRGHSLESVIEQIRTQVGHE